MNLISVSPLHRSFRSTVAYPQAYKPQAYRRSMTTGDMPRFSGPMKLVRRIAGNAVMTVGIIGAVLSGGYGFFGLPIFSAASEAKSGVVADQQAMDKDLYLLSHPADRLSGQTEASIIQDFGNNLKNYAALRTELDQKTLAQQIDALNLDATDRAAIQTYMNQMLQNGTATRGGGDGPGAVKGVAYGYQSNQPGAYSDIQMFDDFADQVLSRHFTPDQISALKAAARQYVQDQQNYDNTENFFGILALAGLATAVGGWVIKIGTKED